jgi:hypothetical protein
MSTSKEEKARQSRKFIILVMFMFLVSTTVFVVGTYFFVIPRLLVLNMEVASLKNAAHQDNRAEPTITAHIEETPAPSENTPSKTQ